MASTCEDCGYRNSEVRLPLVSSCQRFCLVLKVINFFGGDCEQLKPGGAIPEKGKKITLSVKDITDLSRDVIKVS